MAEAGIAGLRVGLYAADTQLVGVRLVDREGECVGSVQFTSGDDLDVAALPLLKTIELRRRTR